MGNDFEIGWADDLEFESEPEGVDDSDFFGKDLFDDVRVSADGTRAVTVSLDFERGSPRMDYVVRLWDMKTGKVIANLARSITGQERWSKDDETPSEAYSAPEPEGVLAFDSDSKRLLVVFADGTVRVWNAADGSEVICVNGSSEVTIGTLTSACFSSDGRSIVAGAHSGMARVWSVPSGVEVATLVGHKDQINWVDFSHTGRTVVTCSRDGTARLWRAPGGRPLLAFSDHGASVNHAAFSPDDCFVATVSEDGVGLLWDVVTGRVHMELRGHEAGVSRAAFSSNGSRIATASFVEKRVFRNTEYKATIRVWDVAKVLG